MTSVGVAIRITSPDEWRLIEHATAFAKQRGETCYVISVVPAIAYAPDEVEIVQKNLQRITDACAVPVIQEGGDVAPTLLGVARMFGIDTMFLQSGSARLLGRSIAERLLLLDPPFDVVVIGSG